MYSENELVNLLESPKNKGLLKHLYGSDEKVADSQVKRYKTLIEQFQSHFSKAQNPLYLFSTPGRTEIGGNHTDHNNGRVLAASVNFDSVAVASKTNTGIIQVYSEGFPNVFTVSLDKLKPVKDEEDTTNALIRGIAAKFHDLGYNIGGFNAYISSNVKKGSGLSSSASIEVLIGNILSSLYNNDIVSPQELAKIGQWSENVYFNKPCGLMDQMACAVGGFVAMDFRDNQRPIIKKIDFDMVDSGYHLIVVDTGGNHADLTQDYADIPMEMKKVANALGKSVLRELTLADLIKDVPRLRKQLGDRAILRAMHFFDDDARVVEQATALEAKRFDDFLMLVNQSGSSSWRLLQNCYTNKNPQEQGITIALAITEEFLRDKKIKGACRVHGGGFAGTIQAYIPDNYLNEYVAFVENIFGRNSATVLNIRPVGTLCLNKQLLLP